MEPKSWFWIVFLLWILASGWDGLTPATNPNSRFARWGSWLLTAILIALLGYGIFHGPVKG